jgi:CRP-like cAMP-binding protein
MATLKLVSTKQFPGPALRPGERTSVGGKAVGNKILLAIPDAEYRMLRPHLQYLKLPHHCSLHEPHRRMKFIHFLNEGLVSLIVVMKDGKTVEAGIIGNEGVTGASGIAGLPRSPLREIMQIGGNGFRMEISVMPKLLAAAPQFRQIVGRFMTVLGMQVSQTAACNRVHTIEQRLARWLLMAQKRIDSGPLPITHDFLATMLGTDRPSVTLAAGALQKLALIEYSRGAVNILNRKKLEEFACECYAVIQQYSGEF